jgi:hypothetical protein
MRSTAAFVIAAGLAATVLGQTPSSTVPRTPWGHPDLQGVWTNETLTLLERPLELGSKEYFTEAEATEYLKTALDRLLASVNLQQDAALSGEFTPGLWVDVRALVPTRRTSLIVGPTGRIPPLVPAARTRPAAPTQGSDRQTDGPEARSLMERCIAFPVGGPPMLPSVGYNSNYQIVQTPTHVTILAEMGSAVRVIPLDGRPHLPGSLRQWSGDSRGRWEGDTLVVETINFDDKRRFRGSTWSLQLVERFRRPTRDMIIYEFTATDPDTWADSWTAEIPMRQLGSQIYEFACHEGNYGLANILKGARYEERVGAAR